MTIFQIKVISKKILILIKACKVLPRRKHSTFFFYFFQYHMMEIQTLKRGDYSQCPPSLISFIRGRNQAQELFYATRIEQLLIRHCWSKELRLSVRFCSAFCVLLVKNRTEKSTWIFHVKTRVHSIYMHTDYVTLNVILNKIYVHHTYMIYTYITYM